MIELKEIVEKDFYRPTAAEGERCLTSCRWNIKAKVGERHMLLPDDLVPAAKLTPWQALLELQDVVYRDSKLRAPDHAGGDPVRIRGISLLALAESKEPEGWLKGVRKYLSGRREHYQDYRFPWRPPVDGIIREGWEV